MRALIFRELFVCIAQELRTPPSKITLAHALHSTGGARVLFACRVPRVCTLRGIYSDLFGVFASLSPNTGSCSCVPVLQTTQLISLRGLCAVGFVFLLPFICAFSVFVFCLRNPVTDAVEKPDQPDYIRHSVRPVGCYRARGWADAKPLKSAKVLSIKEC